jgi:hypothetical protein
LGEVWRREKTLGLARVLLGSQVGSERLFGGTAAGFDAGAGRGKKRSGGADYGKDSGGIFRGVIASTLCVQREGDG